MGAGWTTPSSRSERPLDAGARKVQPDLVPQREVTLRAREYSKSGGSNYVDNNSNSGESGANEDDSKS